MKVLCDKRDRETRDRTGEGGRGKKSRGWCSKVEAAPKDIRHLEKTVAGSRCHRGRKSVDKGGG